MQSVFQLLVFRYFSRFVVVLALINCGGGFRSTDSATLAASLASSSYSLDQVPKPTVALPAPALVPSQNTFFALSGNPIPQKQVFAHYVTCCGFGGPKRGIAAAEEDIIMAQSMGITGFVLNAGAWSSSYQSAVANMFAAAAALNSGFKLFFSADMTGLTAANVVTMMEAYASNPYYFHYNGRPVLSTFSGETETNSTYTTPVAWWTNEVLAPLQTAGINTFFVPGFQDVAPFPTQTSQSYWNQYVAGQVADWNSIVQGLMTWQLLSAVSNTGGNALAIPIMNAYTSALNAVGKVYMPGINTKYWGSIQSNNGNIYFEWQGGASMDAQWGAAITNNVPWVEILTWNDFNESYMMPMDDFEKYFNWRFPTGFTKPSLGYAEMLRYYIAWFRTGVRPTITKDAVFWFYRTHPASATATNRTIPTGQTTGPVTRYVPNSPSGAVPPNADQIYATVFATSPATLSLNGTSETVAAGINQFSTLFVAGPAPTFSLSRSGTTVMSGTGADAIQSHPVYYDWWNSSGFIEGP